MKGLMRLGILVAAMVLTAGCGGGSGDDPGSPSPGPSPVSPGSGSGSGTTPDPGTTPDQPNPSDNETAIAFSAQQQQGLDVTRAGQAAQGGTRGSTPLESSGVRSFKVWGFKNMWNGDLQIVFPGYTVNWKEGTANSTTTNTDGWEYVNQPGNEEQTIKYWDWSVKAYRFFGVAETPAGIGKADVSRWNEGVIVLTADATNEASIPYYSRLWYSTGILPEYSSRQFGKPVQLEFVKPISKVRIMFTSSDPTVSLDELELADPQFMPADEHEIVIKGTFTVSYPLTGDDEISETWGVDYDEDDSEAVTSWLSTIIGRDDVWNMVLPAKGQGIYKLIVNVSGEPRPCFVPAAYMDWLPGYEYTYIFKVNEEGSVLFGEVLSAYTDWEDYEKEAEHTVYNW